MPFTPERDSAAVNQPSEQSGPPDSPLRRNPHRPKKPPPITPRRFTKFFTPRAIHGPRVVRTSRKALRDISGPILNTRANNHRQQHSKDEPEHDTIPAGSEGPRGRKRKLSFTALTDSLPSTPLRRTAFFLPSSQEIPHDYAPDNAVCAGSPSKDMDEAPTVFDDDDDDDGDEDEDEEIVPPRAAIQQYRIINTSTNVLFSRLSGRRTKTEPHKSNLWRDETAGFFSVPSDVHSCTSINGPHVVLPFCAASCNTNSLTAVGDEEGSVRLLDSATGDRDGFVKQYLSLKVHNNALMDLTFSEDDSLLATASGDQTSQVIDMQTQRTIYVLSGHTSSIKQVRFQPGSSNNVIATCSRDGDVSIWDLRCHEDGPAQHLRSSARAQQNISEENASSFPGMARPSPNLYLPLTNYIRAAHSTSHPRFRNASTRVMENARDRGHFHESSVTSLGFMPDPSRSHLLVTGSSADATIKLWDMRTAYNARRPRPHPVSTTTEPAYHQKHRPFGLTSLAFSGDGSKLYSLCCDHTIYAYSTSHLVLGDAPELSSAPSRPRRAGGSERPGLGPMYAFRHPNLRVGTFYPKLAVRKATGDRPELLAVGSSDGCAVLFPTSERYLPPRTPRTINAKSESAAHWTHRASLQRAPSEPSIHRDSNIDTLPVYRHGTPLIRGHTKEVTGVAWNIDGSLTTVSDDFSARCWREDPAQARALRQGGESEGRRWMAGWADIGDDGSYDDDE